MPYFAASLQELRDERLALEAEDTDDIHILMSIAQAVVTACSSPGDVVLDPFAGYGTTLAACEALGRHGIGIDLLPEHLEISQARAPLSRHIEGDSRGLFQLITEPVDLCFTAPPFLTRNDHPADPLTAYELDRGTYSSYLHDLADIAGQVRRLLRPGGFLVMNVANIRYRDVTTALAWDVRTAIDPVIPFIAESTIVWDELPHDFTGDYLLVFQNPI